MKGGEPAVRGTRIPPLSTLTPVTTSLFQTCNANHKTRRSLGFARISSHCSLKLPKQHHAELRQRLAPPINTTSMPLFKSDEIIAATAPMKRIHT
jgi:hypothetical protein